MKIVKIQASLEFFFRKILSMILTLNLASLKIEIFPLSLRFRTCFTILSNFEFELKD